jgi:hypothetical protein
MEVSSNWADCRILKVKQRILGKIKRTFEETFCVYVQDRLRKYIIPKFCIFLPDYTGCPRRNVPDFGRVFLMLKYTDVT